MYNISWKVTMEYSIQQKRAIEHKDGPALVLAVPGAGKTTVLLERINNLIKSGVDDQSILVMTFSKAQALDMEARFLKINKSSKVHFSTIHSFAYAIVRNHARKNASTVNLIEASESYNKYSLLYKFHYQVNKTMITDEDMEEFFRVSGYIKNTLLNYDVYKKLYGRSIKNFEQIYHLYESFKQEHNLIDFDDMLVLALKILQENDDMLSMLQNKYKYVQIDEGQDSSLVQLKIVSLIAKPDNNIFIVADDDQSIYGFRGASSKQLLDFKKIYKDSSIYLMEDNYRSAKNIVSLSNKLIKNNKNRYGKNLKSVNELEDKIEIINAKNTRIQTNHVIKKALEYTKKGESVAILYRNNISSINYINAFEDNDPFYIKDGKMAFYTHFIISDVIDILNFSMDRSDIKSFEKIYYKLNMYLKKDFINQIKNMDPSMDIISRLEECDGVNRFYMEKFDLLDFFVDKIRSSNVDKALEIIFDQLGYGEYLEELSRRNKTPMITYKRVIDTIFNVSKGLKKLKDLEEKFIYLKTKQKEHSKYSSPITLSTIHGAKGLEYDNVFLIDMIEDEFPSAFSLKSDDPDILEEERRLFYVAMTRARKRLSIISLKNLAKGKAEISMFIKEIIK